MRRRAQMIEQRIVERYPVERNEKRKTWIRIFSSDFEGYALKVLRANERVDKE